MPRETNVNCSDPVKHLYCTVHVFLLELAASTEQTYRLFGNFFVFVVVFYFRSVPKLGSINVNYPQACPQTAATAPGAQSLRLEQVSLITSASPLRVLRARLFYTLHSEECVRMRKNTQ